MHQPGDNQDATGFSGLQEKMVHLCSMLCRMRCLRLILHHDLSHRDCSHHNILLQNQSHRHRQNPPFFRWEKQKESG